MSVACVSFAFGNNEGVEMQARTTASPTCKRPNAGIYHTRDEISVKIVIEEGIHQFQGNSRVCPCAE